MNSNEYIEKLNRREWLLGIASKYRDHLTVIEKSNGEYTVQAIQYSWHGTATFCVNSHRSIPAQFIYDGLKVALANIMLEIRDLEIELKSVTVELATPKNE